jgi:hypothetical protein
MVMVLLNLLRFEQACPTGSVSLSFSFVILAAIFKMHLKSTLQLLTSPKAF